MTPSVLALALALRARLAVLDDELLAALRALLPPTATPRRLEIVRPGQTQRDVSRLERPRGPGLPVEAFEPPTRSRRSGARRRCYSSCLIHGNGEAA